MLGTVLYSLTNRTVGRIDLTHDERRHLMSALEEAVPEESYVVGMILDDPAQPLARIPNRSRE